VKKLSKKQGSGKTSLAGATLLREPNRDHEKKQAFKSDELMELRRGTY